MFSVLRKNFRRTCITEIVICFKWKNVKCLDSIIYITTKIKCYYHFYI